MERRLYLRYPDSLWARFAINGVIFWLAGQRDPSFWPREPCWIWIGGKNGPRKKKGYEHQKGGYGYVKRNGIMTRVHHCTYEILRGPINGQIPRHDCDTPACGNPWHITLGTQGENLQDAWDRGHR